MRDECAWVAGQARWVRIDHDRIGALARDIAATPALEQTIDPRAHYLGHGDDTLAFFVVLDAINFGSGYFPHLAKRPGMSGYFTIATCLTERFAARGPWRAEELARITADECADVFNQPRDNTVAARLMVLFARALRDLGRLLIARYDGDVRALVGAAGHSASRLVGILNDMPLFRDVAGYRGRPIPFFKRAQLLAADLALAFGGRGYGRFTDLDRLTIFADNLVPHVLRMDGVLEYDEALLARINAGELIPAGSPEEVEIRACAVHAAEVLTRDVTRLGRAATPQMLDYLLWTRGQGASYKAVPRHRTRTTAY